MYCQFVTKLSILRKSSSESVDNALVENKFKEHMHVTRSVEDELRDVLRKIKNPYFFKVGKFVVKSTFDEDGYTIGECLKALLML